MPTSKLTKRALAASIATLLEKKPLDRITIKDITDECGVTRNTFYYHFEDKYDLVNWYFQSGVTQFLVERSAYASWNALLEAVEDYLLENKVFYCNALAYTGQNSLQQYIFDYLSSIFMQRAKELRPGIGADEKLLVGRFFAGALMGILQPWVLGGMKTNTTRPSQAVPLLSVDELELILRGELGETHEPSKLPQ